MTDDEQQIRNVVAEWMDVTRRGDLDRVLELMTDDVLFLVPGRPPMRKSDFVAASQAQQGGHRSQFDGHSEIVEVNVLGDWAYLWTRLAVTITHDGERLRRSGHTLSIMRKEQGRWRLARDANLLGPPEPV